MTATAGEEEVLDQELDTSESDDNTDSQNDTVSDETTSERKNTSNWKKMSEAKKQAEFRAQEAERIAQESMAELAKVKEWANSLYEDDTQKPFLKKEEPSMDVNAKLEQKIFLIENKEASEYIDDVNLARKKYNMDFDEAWTFVKAKLPPESKTKRDFDATTKTPSVKKDLKNVSEADSIDLTPEERKQWRKVHGYV